MRTMDHRTCQMLHFRKRLLERFGLKMTAEVYWSLCERVRTHYADFVRVPVKCPLPVELPDGRIVWVMYDPKTKGLATVVESRRGLQEHVRKNGRRSGHRPGRSEARMGRIERKSRLDQINRDEEELGS